MAKNRRRDDEDDDGYEVVDNPPPKKKKPPFEDDAPRKQKPVTGDRDGFEVVDDPPPRKKPRRSDDETRPNRIAQTRADDDFEVVDESPRKPKRPVETDDRDDDRPRKKKQKLSKSEKNRIRREMDEEREDAKINEMMEWAGPIFLTFLGVAMIVVSGIIMTRKLDAGISIGLMLFATTLWTIILVPIVIVSLMIIGSIAGIEYGTLKNAVRSLVAITFLVNGIYWLGNWVPFLGFFVTPIIASIVTFALFMTFFRLDPQETSTSLGILNLILFISNIGFKMLILAMLMRGAGGGGGIGNRPANNFDDDDDDINQPRIGVREDFDAGKRGKPKRAPVEFDDDP